MSDHSKIEWTDATWPIVSGCTKVSEGCRHCYAISDAWRLSHNPNPKVSSVYASTVEKRAGKIDWTGLVKTHPDRLDWPLQWRKPRKIFVCNESDLFHEDVPEEFIADVYSVMVAAWWHTYQVLSKRPERRAALLHNPTFRDMVANLAAGRINKLRGHFSYQATVNLAAWNQSPGRNIHEGVSIEDRKALWRVEKLHRTPAAIRFLSIEPLLEDIGTLDLTGIDLCIVGGESGPVARPCHMDWARSIRDQCKGAGVRFFFKQAGSNVHDRDDVGFDGDWNDNEFFAQSWPEGTETEDNQNGFRGEYHGAPVRVCLKDKKGGNMSEWPADLRVRELP